MFSFREQIRYTKDINIVRYSRYILLSLLGMPADCPGYGMVCNKNTRYGWYGTCRNYKDAGVSRAVTMATYDNITKAISCVAFYVSRLAVLPSSIAIRNVQLLP